MDVKEEPEDEDDVPLVVRNLNFLKILIIQFKKIFFTMIAINKFFVIFFVGLFLNNMYSLGLGCFY